jgi:hypothetical protein
MDTTRVQLGHINHQEARQLVQLIITCDDVAGGREYKAKGHIICIFILFAVIFFKNLIYNTRRE